jgi:hypothetical protein
MTNTIPTTTALQCLARGWYPLPLCWPVAGACGCGRGHDAHSTGKAPLLGAGYQNLRPTEADVRRWWTQWPQANVGLLLEPSGLLFVGPDSPAALEQVLKWGVPPTCVRISQNTGYLYRRPPGCAITTRKILNGVLDIKTNGYCVAYGAHRSGADIFLELEDFLDDAPAWAVKLLGSAQSSTTKVQPLPASLPSVDVDALQVSDRIRRLIHTGQDNTRYASRSEGLFAVLVALARAGCDDETIAGIVMNNPIGEKAREKGLQWLAGEIARARAAHARQSLAAAFEIQVEVGQ